MAGLFFLGVGALCAVIGRILLATAAFQISIWWGLGVLLPFGPVLFRLSYPEEAQSSRMFRLATLPCLMLYLVLGPGVVPGYHHSNSAFSLSPKLPSGYAMEPSGKPSASPTAATSTSSSLAARAIANDREFERLQKWNAKLRLEKRDLLHSDVEGNRAYDLELAQYEESLAKAVAEKNALMAAAQK